MKRNVIHVKKYANHKLYVIEEARYVSMLELSSMVAAGAAPIVTRDEDGADRTIETLGRALYERLKARDREAPAPSCESIEAIICKVKIKEAS